MRGFRVHGPDGVESFIEATRYVVNDDGDLVLFTGDQEVQRVPAASWMAIDPVGQPLGATWPPPSLELLLHRLRREAAARHGVYVHRVGTAEDYSSPRLNDLDAFFACFGLQLCLDPESTEHQQMYRDLRHLIRRHFTTHT